VVGVFYVYTNYPDKIESLKALGYPGAFLISIILNATVLLPVGNIAIIITLGAALNPVFVGLAGGIGAAIGEMSGYMAGYSGRAIIQRQKVYNRLERWVKKWGAFAIFFLSVGPFFFDLAGIAAGALRMPLWKFFIACWLGRTIAYIVATRYGFPLWEAFSSYFNLRSC
jgi:membrane protein DedA with SNARE-associated domain